MKMNRPPRFEIRHLGDTKAMWNFMNCLWKEDIELKKKLNLKEKHK